MKARYPFTIVIIFLTLCTLASVPAPAPPSSGSASATMPSSPPRKQSDQRITLLHTDELYKDPRVSRTGQVLVGNVRFRHEGVIMTCDSALYYEASNSFDAFGNVKMNQADTLTLVSDVLFYDGADQMARARYNVILTHRQSKLYCDSLDYDRLYDLGYFYQLCICMLA